MSRTHGGYDTDPRLVHVPLEPETVEALLLTDGSALVSSPGRVRHLLSRVRAAFVAHQERVRSMQRDVELMRSTAARNSQDPVTAALEALARCSPEQQRLVFDRRAQVMVATVEHANTVADAARVAAASETNRARLVLASVLSVPDLPEQVRQQVQAALEQIPVMRHPVPVPVPPTVGSFVQPSPAPTGDGTGLGQELFA